MYLDCETGMASEAYNKEGWKIGQKSELLLYSYSL